MKSKLDLVGDWFRKAERDLQSFESMVDVASNLSGYAVEIRYPDDMFEPGITDANDALVVAEKFKTKILSQLPALK